MEHNFYWGCPQPGPSQAQSAQGEAVPPEQMLNSMYQMDFPPELVLAENFDCTRRSVPYAQLENELMQYWDSGTVGTFPNSIYQLFSHSVTRMINLRCKFEKKKDKLITQLKHARCLAFNHSSLKNQELAFKGKNLCLLPHAKEDTFLVEANNGYILAIEAIKNDANQKIIDAFIASTESLLESFSTASLEKRLHQDFKDKYMSVCFSNMNHFDSKYVIMQQDEQLPISFCIRKLALSISENTAFNRLFDGVISRESKAKLSQEKITKESAAQSIAQAMEMDAGAQNVDLKTAIDNLEQRVIEKLSVSSKSLLKAPKTKSGPKNGGSPAPRGRSPSRSSRGSNQHTHNARDQSQSPGRKGRSRSRSLSRSRSPQARVQRRKSQSPGPARSSRSPRRLSQSPHPGILRNTRKHTQDSRQKSPTSPKRARPSRSQSPAAPVPGRNASNVTFRDHSHGRGSKNSFNRNKQQFHKAGRRNTDGNGFLSRPSHSS